MAYKGLNSAILIKRCLFTFLKNSSLDLCYRCNRKMTVQDFSIDHKLRHEGDSEKFWDENNITFSHFRCNAAANGASEKRWITNGVENKLVLNTFQLPKGWRNGRKQYIIKKGIRVLKEGKNHPMFGRKSNKQRNKIGQFI